MTLEKYLAYTPNCVMGNIFEMAEFVVTHFFPPPIIRQSLKQFGISWAAMVMKNYDRRFNLLLSRPEFSQNYSVFQGFSKAKSANGGSILSLSQFLILLQLPQKMELASKVVKVDSKIIISLPEI
jgi:hypothetical protein